MGDGILLNRDVWMHVITRFLEPYEILQMRTTCKVFCLLLSCDALWSRFIATPRVCVLRTLALENQTLQKRKAGVLRAVFQQNQRRRDVIRYDIARLERELGEVQEALDADLFYYQRLHCPLRVPRPRPNVPEYLQPPPWAPASVPHRTNEEFGTAHVLAEAHQPDCPKLSIPKKMNAQIVRASFHRATSVLEDRAQSEASQSAPLAGPPAPGPATPSASHSAPGVPAARTPPAAGYTSRSHRSPPHTPYLSSS